MVYNHAMDAYAGMVDAFIQEEATRWFCLMGMERTRLNRLNWTKQYVQSVPFSSVPYAKLQGSIWKFTEG